MNKKTARSLLVDFLYDELSATDEKKLKQYLDRHPELLEELKELRQTQKILQKMPEAESPQQLVMMEPRQRTFWQWWADAGRLLPQSGWGKTVLAAAACILLFLIVGAAANLQFKSTHAGFTVNMSYQPPPDHGLTTKQAEAIVQKVQQQNAIMLTKFAERMNQQDQLQLQKVVKYFQAQRLRDLQLIGQNMEQVQLTSTYRWQQTNQVLDKIIQTATAQPQP